MTYRAFISYSHTDDDVASRLHKKIESFKPPADIGDGRRIAPVFRDREELSTTSDLPLALKEALERSENLIVLCSPLAAQSRWVGEEIRYFAACHGSARIHPVIVGDSPQVCFPPALIDVAPQPLAADLREIGDGFADGSLKLIAGLLGAPYARIKNRELARARRRARINGALAAAFCVLLFAAATAAWQALRQAERAEAELARAEAAILASVRGVEGIVGQITRDAQSGQIRTSVAGTLLKSVRNDVETVIDIAPDNARLLVEHGELLTQLAAYHRRVGDLPAAIESASAADDILRKVVADTSDPEAVNWLANALVEQSDHARLSGESENALNIATEALDLYRRIESLPETQDQWLVNQAVALDRIARAKDELGLTNEAIALVDRALELLERKFADQTFAPARRQIAVLHSLLAELYLESDAAIATGHSELTTKIMSDLLEIDPTNVLYRRDLSFSLIDTGDIARLAGDRLRAIELFDRALKIRRSLVDFDPNNLLYLRDLSVAHERLGVVKSVPGEFAAALAHLESSAEIANVLLAEDPGNASWREDAVIAYEKIGQAHLLAGDLSLAFDAFASAGSVRFAVLADVEDTATKDAQRLLSIGDARLEGGLATDALMAYFHGYVFLDQFAESEAAQMDLWRYIRGIADAYRLLDDQATARHFYREAIGAAIGAPNSTEAIQEMLRVSESISE